MTKRNLIVDVNNILWKIRHTTRLNKRKKDAFVPQLLFLKFIDEMNAMFKKYQCTGAVCAFEGRNNWRKTVYTDYKNREIDDIYYEDVQEAIVMLREFLEEHTSIYSLSVTGAEADDVIAVVCQESSDDVENIIISSDRDFVQLLKHDGVRLFSPQQNEERTCEDPEFELFLKCVRGDPSDNIYSAYPRVRKTKLEEAFYGESISYLNLMETINKDGTKVGDRYTDNRLLIDLEKQPTGVRSRISDSIANYVTGKYNQGAVMRYARENNLMKMIEGCMSGSYTKLFNAKIAY